MLESTSAEIPRLSNLPRTCTWPHLQVTASLYRQDVLLARARWYPSSEHVSEGFEPWQGQEDKIEGSIWDLQEGMSSRSMPLKAPDAKEWRPFAESQTTQLSISPPSNVSGASNGYRPQQHASGSSVGSSETWGFMQDSFTPVRNNVQASKFSGKTSSDGESKGNPAVYDSYSSKSEGRSSRSITQSQPAGWAGF